MTAGVSIVVHGNLPGDNTWSNIEREMHLQAPTLTHDLTLMVKGVTPVWTGALESDITGIPNPGGNDLALIFAEDSHQLGAWGRIYVAYQEGPPQGLSTYTNPPRLMFQGTADGDGLALVEAWAMVAVSTGISIPGGSTFGGGNYGFA